MFFSFSLSLFLSEYHLFFGPSVCAATCLFLSLSDSASISIVYCLSVSVSLSIFLCLRIYFHIFSKGYLTVEHISLAFTIPLLVYH